MPRPQATRSMGPWQSPWPRDASSKMPLHWRTPLGPWRPLELGPSLRCLRGTRWKRCYKALVVHSGRVHAGAFMTIRTYQPGDEAAQVSIYNEAAVHLPKFKAATLDEIRRRYRAVDFDPGTRFYAIAGGQPVGYATFHTNGRISYPWCCKGHENCAEPLFQSVLAAMQERRMPRAFAAYRADWTAPLEFFAAHGFQKRRDMVNFVQDLVDMPTPATKQGIPYSCLQPSDLPALMRLAPEVLRTTSIEALERHFFHNPYFPANSFFVLRSRQDGEAE